MDKKREQFIDTYNKEADAIFRFCLIRTSQKEVAVDMTQDTFLRFWDTMAKGEKIDYPKAFLFKIAKNLVIDWYRKKKATSLDFLTDDEEGGSEELLMDKNSVELELSSDGRLALEKIDNLPKIYQEVVYLRFVEDLKPREIAEVLGESVNVVSVRITRGIEALRKITGLDNKN